MPLAAASERFVYAGQYSSYRPQKNGKLNDLSEKEDHPNIQPSTRRGIDQGTSGLVRQRSYHCANPSANNCNMFQSSSEVKSSVYLY